MVMFVKVIFTLREHRLRESRYRSECGRNL